MRAVTPGRQWCPVGHCPTGDIETTVLVRNLSGNTESALHIGSRLGRHLLESVIWQSPRGKRNYNRGAEDSKMARADSG